MAFKNPYSDKLGEFSSHTFNEPDISRFHRAEGGGWDEYFRERMLPGIPRALVLEIGCSNSEFLCGLASANPDVAFVGLDWKFKAVYKGARRIARGGLKNVALLRCHVKALPQIFGPGDLDEIWIFFPDPWAKKPQLKHRLIQEKFLLEAARVLKPGGRVFIKTDHPGYFQWMLALFGAEQPVLPDYDNSDPGYRSYKARQIKVRRLEDGAELPRASEAARAAFSLDRFSTDYWHQPRLSETLFRETATLFEKAFVTQKLPIYYLELTRSR